MREIVKSWVRVPGTGYLVTCTGTENLYTNFTIDILKSYDLITIVQWPAKLKLNGDICYVDAPIANSSDAHTAALGKQKKSFKV